MDFIDFKRMIWQPRLELKLSGTLMKKLVFPLKQVAKEATVFYFANGISIMALHPEQIFTVALRINSTAFDYFKCKDEGVARINLHHLYGKLMRSTNEDLVTIHADEGNDKTIGFLFEDRNSRVETEMELIEFKNEHVAISSRLPYVYKVELGIPATEFRRIFFSLARSKEIGLVFITITNTEVEFSAIHTKFVLEKERGDYTIRGVEEKDQVFFMMDLSYYVLFLHLSRFTSTVYVQYSCHDEPPVLNFPVSAVDDGNDISPVIGNIMFYFTSSEDK